jgi:ribonucleoside-triphosphate reductase (thioredoxin)
LTIKNSSPFPSSYEEFIHISRYARWLPEENRREMWDETVSRLTSYYCNHTQDKIDWLRFDQGEHSVMTDIYDAIYRLEVMPSMRALMTAGPAMDRCHVPAYNCAYLPVDSPRSFDEAMYILLCGTGVGYSVETKYIEQLPRVSEVFEGTDTIITVADSKEGWAKAFRELISLLIAGQVPKWDVSGVRPAGARLRTFGGRASGPEPLVDLFKFTISLFRKAAGRRLTSVECHDLLCKVGDVVVVGGVRRSAMISLFDCTDDRMSKSKFGAWWTDNPQRALANNSGVYEHRRPDIGFFMEKWQELYDSKSGEPGFFSRYACQQIAARNGRRDATPDFGTNPCSEIILRPFQFCNLTEVVVRSDDTSDSLARKVRIATILGTIQSTFTDFKYLRKKWRDNCEEERLLGVSLTGVCDNIDLVGDPKVLANLRNVAVETNKEWADRLGINQSTAITCVKPSGTVSQLVNSASGLHARHADYYLRTVRADNKDPLTQFLKDQGVYFEPCVMKGDTTTVFYFAVKAPEGSLTRDYQSSIEALELWKTLQDHWCEHKPSATINVREEEWMDVGAWVYKNFDDLSGVSFLPHDGGSYKQAPYQEVSKEEYEAWIAEHPPVVVDWMLLREYESEDNTTGSQELACTGGSCEITDIIANNKGN